MTAGELSLRRATVADTAPILKLINELAVRQVMLPRSPASVLENLRDFVVAEQNGAFVGCGALHIVWSDLAEIRSIAVAPDAQKSGIGFAMAEELLDDARALGIARVFAFTYVAEFFAKLGFHEVEHESLPHKVFSDCMNCPKFTQCDEIAVMRVLDAEAPVTIERAVSEVPLPRRR